MLNVLERKECILEVTPTLRGFGIITHKSSPTWLPERLVQESSAIGDYEDAFDNPGSSFLWIGSHELNREEVAEFIQHLQHWLDTKCLFPEGRPTEEEKPTDEP